MSPLLGCRPILIFPPFSRTVATHPHVILLDAGLAPDRRSTSEAGGGSRGRSNAERGAASWKEVNWYLRLHACSASHRPCRQSSGSAVAHLKSRKTATLTYCGRTWHLGSRTAVSRRETSSGFASGSCKRSHPVNTATSCSSGKTIRRWPPKPRPIHM